MAELMKQGQQKVAMLVKRELEAGRGTRQLESVLDLLLNPQADFDRDKSDWLQWLMAGGEPPDDFLKALRQTNTSPICGLVWNAQFVAYRCRDCAISPCMSLCADCFQGGNHEGHDFNMFRSQAGGACDCGDENVMRKQGFCCNHGSEHTSKKKTVPEEMIALAKFIIPKLILKMYDDLKTIRSENVMYMISPGLSQLLSLLSKICEADVLRNITTTSIMSPIKEIAVVANHKPIISSNSASKLQATNSTASGHTVVHPVPSEPAEVDFMSGQGDFSVRDSKLEQNDWFGFIRDFQSKSCKGLSADPSTVTFLDFLMHVLVKCEFPNGLTTFMLQLFPNLDYKIAFTRSFCRHYKEIARSLAQSATPDKLSNNFVHVSVQLFSNDTLASTMVMEEDLLHALVNSLVDMVGECLKPYEYEGVTPGKSSSVLVANCDEPVLTKHCYWPITSDLINILSHKEILRMFLEDESLTQRWLYLVSLLTAMNVNSRKVTSHLEYEPRTYITSFSVEFESVAAVLWELIRGCSKLENSGQYCVKMIRAIESTMRDWYAFVPTRPSKSTATFHLSLHRYLALFTSQAIVRFGMKDKEVLPADKLIAKWMEYPLRTLVALNEIRSGLWVYNGFQIRGQAQSYVQCHFCNSMVDLDIFFLQIAASKLDSDYFLKLLVERFSLNSWFQFGEPKQKNPERLNDYKEKLMVEGFLNMILTLLTQRVFSGASDLEECRKDLAALLCVGSKTHSQLSDLIPTRPGESSDVTKNFEIALKEMANFNAPKLDTDAMQQGKYTPKDEIWDKHFDYAHIQLRCYSPADHQTALDRYATNMQQRGLTSHAHCWPPQKDLDPIHPAFKGVFRLLGSDTLHKILAFVVYKAVKNMNDVTETILMTTIKLLQLAVNVPVFQMDKGFIPFEEESDKRMKIAVKCLDFLQKHGTDIKSPYGICRYKEKLDIKKELYAQLKEGHEISPDTSIEDVVVILQLELFVRNKFAVFEPMLTHMDSIVQENNYGEDLPLLANRVKNLDYRLNMISAERYELLKKLFLQWKKCSENDNVDVTDYAFCEQLSKERPGFSLLVRYFVDNYDWLFAIHSTSSNGPSTVFDINYDASSLIENASRHVCGGIEKRGEPSKEGEGEGSVCETDSPMMSAGESPVVEKQETLISLLSKLLIKLSEGSKTTPVRKPCENDSSKKFTAGDGSYHVTELLVSLANSSSTNEELVYDLCPSISQRNEAKKKRIEVEESTESLKADRRKRAMARQQKILAEFMSKQEVFRDNVESREMEMEVDEEDIGGSSKADEMFDCVICGQSSATTSDRPIGVSVLMQATKVLGKRREEEDYYELPNREANKSYHTCSDSVEIRISGMVQAFSKVAAGRAVEVGLDRGVHVQTCGHYIHFDCQKSYIKSLQDERNRSLGYDQHIFDINNGYFGCPLCRQPCNGVLPILPDTIRKRDSRQVQNTYPELTTEITSLLTKYSEAGSLSLLTAKALEFSVLTASSSSFVSLLASTLKSFESNETSFYSDRPIKEKFLILLATFRSCLELEYVKVCKGIKQLGGSRSCLASLHEILQFHSQCLDGPNISVWRELISDPGSLSANENGESSRATVPLLLNDALSLLLQFVLTWPTWITEAHFRCLVKAFYNVVVTQALVTISFELHDEESLTLERIARNMQRETTMTITEMLGVVCSSVSRVKARFGHTKEETGISQSLQTPQAIDLRVQKFCLPFLRQAAMLSTVLFGTEVNFTQDHDEFANLSTTLSLLDKEAVSALSRAPLTSDHMVWAHANPISVVKKWCEKASCVFERPEVPDLSLFPAYHNWSSPRLLPLPGSYDSLFQFYRKQKCRECNTIPNDPAICLVCGAFVCFRALCCSDAQGIYECVQHSMSCGCGTSIFLIVSSSAILVIRAERAVLWGSVYLDSFGEEDRDLKRGKPLFLSRERFERLEHQWLTHSFDRTCKRWVWHNNKL